MNTRDKVTGKYHGYWEWKVCGIITSRGHYHYNLYIGYWERFRGGKLVIKLYYII